jgi:hypothetical protein
MHVSEASLVRHSFIVTSQIFWGKLNITALRCGTFIDPLLITNCDGQTEMFVMLLIC